LFSRWHLALFSSSAPLREIIFIDFCVRAQPGMKVRVKVR
jgi:hypothetical protein